MTRPNSKTPEEIAALKTKFLINAGKCLTRARTLAVPHSTLSSALSAEELEFCQYMNLCLGKAVLHLRDHATETDFQKMWEGCLSDVEGTLDVTISNYCTVKFPTSDALNTKERESARLFPGAHYQVSQSTLTRLSKRKSSEFEAAAIAQINAKFQNAAAKTVAQSEAFDRVMDAASALGKPFCLDGEEDFCHRLNKLLFNRALQIRSANPSGFGADWKDFITKVRGGKEGFMEDVKTHNEELVTFSNPPTLAAFMRDQLPSLPKPTEANIADEKFFKSDFEQAALANFKETLRLKSATTTATSSTYSAGAAAAAGASSARTPSKSADKTSDVEEQPSRKTTVSELRAAFEEKDKQQQPTR